MDASPEQLLLTIFAQMPFVLLLYYLYKNERDERVKAHAAQIEHLETTIKKNEERHGIAYDRACQIYEKALDHTTNSLRLERNRRYGKAAGDTDLGDHPTATKLGL